MTDGDLQEEQWELIAPLLPKHKRRGRPRADDRRTLNGILWILRSGARWDAQVKLDWRRAFLDGSFAPAKRGGEHYAITQYGTTDRQPDPGPGTPSYGAQQGCLFLWLGNQQELDNRYREKREEPEYHRLLAWDKLAETCQKYLTKGRKVYVEGRLHTRAYTGKDRTEKTVTEIVLAEMLMLDPTPEAVREALEFQKT
jgi:hypothetical protein